MVASLKASGVRRAYGIPGDSLNGFTDALRRDGRVASEHVRHEEAPVTFGTDLDNPDFAGIATAAGLFDANRSGVLVLGRALIAQAACPIGR